MAYSELIKNFSNIRQYLSQFYIYGFKSRNEYTIKSARSYDNERRRIESWLGEYMRFGTTEDGKNVFISVDSRHISHNPLYTAFKTKSFTSRDIMLHFYILDILNDCSAMSVSDIADTIVREYLPMFEQPEECDESTLRKKLNEYEKAGLITSEKAGKRKLYKLNNNNIVLENLYDTLSFFSEVDPIGVIGSYLLDKFEECENHFGIKHHYILNALESEVLFDLFNAISSNTKVDLEMFSSTRKSQHKCVILPLKIYISTYTGRRYVMGWHYKFRKISFYRLDRIKYVKPLEQDTDTKRYMEYAKEVEKYLWGVSVDKSSNSIVKLEMILRIEKGAEHILNRLIREKRNGVVEQCENGDYKFTVKVFDATELIPWIRTFTGRIVSIKCNDKHIEELIKSDMESMMRMYGVY